ncbi:sensor histidine kinase [Nitrososphaera sp.]|uniref:sensor histidine kinase n=1 Tax=Nitrososphaera sp. TaxID=1971748 RepID=UPI0018402580|nr:sensor histidine kinase [Nitrososphaera sp.]NWG37190.1 sensor histidine kinase [Nitrososphaera sp.]
MSAWGNVGRPLIVIITVALISMTAISSLLVYTSQQTTRTEVELAASKMLRDELGEDARNIANDAQAKFGDIGNVLSLTAGGPVMASRNVPAISDRLDSVQQAISRYVTNIVWLSSNGTLLYATDESTRDKIGADLSDRRFYEVVFVTNTPYVTQSLTGLDDMVSFVVAVPVPRSQSDGSFDGVIAAYSHTDFIVSAVLAPTALSEGEQVAVITNDGIVLAYPDASVIGTNVQDSKFTAVFSQGTRDIAQKSFELMLQGRSGVFDYRDASGNEFTMAYQPVVIDGRHTWSIALIAPSSQLTTPFVAIFGEQQNFTLIATALVATISGVFIGFILFLNRRLFSTVNQQDVKIRGQLAELQGAYERLKEQDVIKDEFINIAAHELRTPVLPIVLSAENLADSMPEEENVKIILRNANRITKLTNDILDVSRIESNTFKLQKQKTNIRRLAEEVIQDARYKMPADQKVELALESSVIPAMEELFIDRSRINQVLVNLVDNAVNFTQEGTIRVAITPEEGNLVRVSVIDGGKGIDPAVREKLFGKFVSKSDRAKGTGLGLYLSKAIVEAHGGTIKGENNVGAKGATFSFTLPVS